MEKYTDREQLDAWMEWKETCDSELCSNANKQFLNEKGNSKANHLLFKYNVKKRVNYGFAIFENYAISHEFVKENHRYKGKSYKNGLFFNVVNSKDNPLEVLNGLFNCYLEKELKNTFFLSEKNWKKEKKTDYILEKLSEDGFCLDDILPSSVNTSENVIAINEILELSKSLADDVIVKLSSEEKVLMAAQYKELKRSDKFIIKFLNTNTSHVTDVLNVNIPKKINLVLAKFKDEDKTALNLLKRCIYDELKNTCFSFISSEHEYKSLLIYMNNVSE